MNLDRRYTFSDTLGEGTYGIVKKAWDKTRKKTVAVKQIKMEDYEDGFPPTALREISLLKEIRSPFVVKLLDVHHDETRLWIVFEHHETDLRNFLNSNELNLQDVKSMAF